jgi:adenylate cyclase class 2
MVRNSQEIEIKLQVADLNTARRLLRGHGFRVEKRRVFESNTVYDTPRLTLRRAEHLLRLRRVGRDVILTYKGPPLASRHKTREELELSLSDGRAFAAILERLGYREAFCYEKYRTTYRQPRAAGEVTLDETPIGVYFELEGSSRWIDRTARLLGFGEDQYITASYGRLYQDWCREHKVRPSHMMFANRKNNRPPDSR